jgi:hypothetical protein
MAGRTLPMAKEKLFAGCRVTWQVRRGSRGIRFA